MNKIVIHKPIIEKSTIKYEYSIEGEWKAAFNELLPLSIEYSCDITNVPESIAIIPLLTNILPISWIYDAEIIVPVCDEDFYDSISDFKRGYKAMYPMIHFGGKMTIKALENNISVLARTGERLQPIDIDNILNDKSVEYNISPLLLNNTWKIKIKIDSIINGFSPLIALISEILPLININNTKAKAPSIK